MSTYYELNKERIRARQKQLRAENPEKYREKNRQWREANKEKMVELRKNWLIGNPAYIMYHNARRRVKGTNIPFDISWRDIMIPDICPVLGIPLFVGEGRMTDNSPSLDRIIPDKGYIKNNISVISMKANRLKNEMSIEDMKKIIRYVEANLSSRG